MWVLDTNTLIFFFKGQGRVSEILLSKAPKQLFIPAIVLYELEVGIAKSSYPERRIRQLDALLGATNLLPFGHAQAKEASKIRSTLENKGQPIGPYDVLIAASAMAQGATLVTNNLKEFKRVDGLSVEDWF